MARTIDNRLTGLPHRLVVGTFIVAFLALALIGWLGGTFDPSRLHPSGFLLLCGWGTAWHQDDQTA